MSVSAPGLAVAADDVAAAIGTEVDDVEVALGPPRLDVTEPGLDVTVVGLRPVAGAFERGRLLQPVMVEMIVAASGPPADQLTLIERAWTGLHLHSRAEVAAAAVPLEWWLSYGVAPRVALRLGAPASLDLTLTTAPVVTEPLTLDDALVGASRRIP